MFGRIFFLYLAALSAVWVPLGMAQYNESGIDKAKQVKFHTKSAAKSLPHPPPGITGLAIYSRLHLEPPRWMGTGRGRLNPSLLPDIPIPESHMRHMETKDPNWTEKMPQYRTKFPPLKSMARRGEMETRGADAVATATVDMLPVAAVVVQNSQLPLHGREHARRDGLAVTTFVTALRITEVAVPSPAPTS